MNSLYGYSTKVFKDIFPDYTEFKNKLDSVLFNEAGVWTGCSEVTFQLLYNKYAGSHLSMNDVEFIQHFSNTLFEHFERFEYDIDIKKQARRVTDEEFSTDGVNINNTSEAPNDYGNTDSDVVESLDRQSKTTSKAGISSVLFKKQEHNRAYYIKTFLGYFRYLFIKIYDPVNTPVWISADGNLIEGD